MPGIKKPAVSPARPFERWVAFYENADKVENAAKERGFTGNDGESWHDFVEAEDNRFRTVRVFYNLDDAVEWVRLEIAANRSVYGCGEVNRQEAPDGDRCRYCTCNGWYTIHEYIVSDEGIDEDRSVDKPCLN